jgi:hypothetical protein
MQKIIYANKGFWKFCKCKIGARGLINLKGGLIMEFHSLKVKSKKEKEKEVEITLNWVGKHNKVPRLRNWAEENKKEFLRKKEAGEIKVSKSVIISRYGNRYKDGDWEYLGGGNFA